MGNTYVLICRSLKCVKEISKCIVRTWIPATFVFIVLYYYGYNVKYILVGRFTIMHHWWNLFL